MIWMVGSREGPFDQSQNFGTECWKFETVLGSPGIDFRTVIGPYVLFVC